MGAGGGGVRKIIWSFVYFHFFKAVNGAFEVQFFQGFMFTSHQRQGHAAQICVKVKILLNNYAIKV